MTKSTISGSPSYKMAFNSETNTGSLPKNLKIFLKAMSVLGLMKRMVGLRILKPLLWTA
jgi:hypothetical protein